MPLKWLNKINNGAKTEYKQTKKNEPSSYQDDMKNIIRITYEYSTLTIPSLEYIL